MQSGEHGQNVLLRFPGKTMVYLGGPGFHNRSLDQIRYDKANKCEDKQVYYYVVSGRYCTEKSIRINMSNAQPTDECLPPSHDSRAGKEALSPVPAVSSMCSPHLLHCIAAQ